MSQMVDGLNTGVGPQDLVLHLQVGDGVFEFDNFFLQILHLTAHCVHQVRLDQILQAQRETFVLRGTCTFVILIWALTIACSMRLSMAPWLLPEALEQHKEETKLTLLHR